MPVTGRISPKGDSANTHSRLTPGAPEWKAAVIRNLRDGYGVEDIAVALQCRVEAVRSLVERLRQSEHLPTIYREARNKWAAAAWDARKAREVRA